MKKIVQDLNTTTARRKNVGRLCFLCVCCPPAKWWAALMACRVREMRHNNVWSSSSDEKKNIKNTSRMLQCFSFCHTQSPCTGVTMMPKSDNRAATTTTKKKTLQKKKKIHRVKVRSVVPKEDYTRNEKQRNGALREKKEPQ